MLYLLKDSRGGKVLVKVGIAKDVERRMAQYKTHNPLAKLMQVATPLDCSDAVAENHCHAYFEDMGYKNVKGTEWYQVPKGRKDYYFEDIARTPYFEYDDLILYTKFEEITTYAKR